MVRIGIEQEIVFKDGEGRYLDFSNTSYETFSQIIDALPAYAGDTRYFHPKSLETQPKRWYVEGFELHDDQGNVTTTVPKGIEIRTTPHSHIDTLLAEFSSSFTALSDEAERYGLIPIPVSQHPFKTAFDFSPDILEHEKRFRNEEAFAIACGAMLAHGMQINISLSVEGDLDDLSNKFRYYFPFFTPLAFSSPFYDGKLFDGLCARNLTRGENRKFVVQRTIEGNRYLEFKGFDACADGTLLYSLLTFVRGFVLDTTLPGRAIWQDSELIRRSSLYGFDNPAIRTEGLRVLDAAAAALGSERETLEPLREIIHTNRSAAFRMRERFLTSGDILGSIGVYNYR